jgi:hypothetical protein
MRSIVVTLGEKPYTVTQLPLRQNAAWQRKVAENAKPLLAAMPSLLSALGPVIQQTGNGWLSALNDQTMPALLDSGSGVLLGVIDAMPVMLDLLYEFDPALNLDKQHIEDEATEEEVIAAFVDIVKMSFPFGSRLGDLLKACQATMAASGGTTAMTTPNSPLPSGDGGTMTSRTSKLPA